MVNPDNPRPQPERIVSLLASGTELVCALGLGERLVGRSHECDNPEWVTRLPAVCRPTFPVCGSSGEIDRLVRARLLAEEPLYEIDDQLLISLKPDVVITQTHCEVCAVSPPDLAHGRMPALVREQVVALSAGSLKGILEGFMDVSRVLGCEGAGHQLVDTLRAQMASIGERTRVLPRRSVVCLEWIDPIFAMGNWGPELVDIAGGQNLLGTQGAHSTSTTFRAVLDADPETLVVAPCGFPIDRTLREMPLLAAQAGWKDLRAVTGGRVFVADGNRYFNRSGPTVFETADILAEILHPEAFSPEHEGSAWVRWKGLSVHRPW